MYKVISISDDEMTRNVKLENSDTGSIEECFDDSALISDINFDFLTIGKEYDCKIKLFGNVVQNMQDKTVICKILSKNELVGRKEMVKVLAENNKYYIPRKKIEKYLDKERFFFQYTRKDLIEVDDILHSDML